MRFFGVLKTPICQHLSTYTNIYQMFDQMSIQGKYTP